MNPDAPQPPPDDREARLTALLLGELSPAEAEAVRAEIAVDPELTKLFRRLSLALDLTREVVTTPEPKELTRPEPLQLASERRAALLAKFKTQPANVVPMPKPARKSSFDGRDLISLAAMLVAVVTAAGMFLPALSKAKSRAQRLSARAAASAPQTIDHFSENSVNREAGGDPVMARRYGLASAAKPANGPAAPASLAEPPMAAVIPPVSTGDAVTSLKSDTKAGNFSRRPLAASALNTGAVAERGREPAQNQIVLPMVEPPAEAASRGEAVAEFFAVQDQPMHGQGFGAGGGNLLGLDNRRQGGYARSAGYGEARNQSAYSSGLDGDDKRLGFKGSTANNYAEQNRSAGANFDVPALAFSVAPQTPPAEANSLVPQTEAKERQAQNGFGRESNVANADFIAPVTGTVAAPQSAGVAFRFRDEAANKQESGLRADFADAATKDTLKRGYLAGADKSQNLGSVGGLVLADRQDAEQAAANSAGATVGKPAIAESESVGLSRYEKAAAEPRMKVSELSDLSAAAFAKGKEDRPAQQVPESRQLAEVDRLSQQVDGLGETKSQVALGLATNAIAPTLGNTPELGQLFKNNAAITVPFAGEQRGLQTLNRPQETAVSLGAQIEPETTLAQKATPVEVIDQASPEPAQGLLAKLRAGLGGDATRTARLKLNNRTPDIQLLGTGTGPQAYDPYFLQTEFEVIKSRQILKQAAEKLNLPATEDTFQQLAVNLAVNQYRNTTIAEIQVRDPDPARAALIANTVADVYAQYRNSMAPAGNQRVLEGLNTQLVQLNQPASVTEASLTQLGQAAAVPAREPDVPLPKLAPGAPEPQAEVATADNAFSTFSLNVSDVSFKLAAAALEKGQMPEPGSVRTEEFINAFDYRDPEPATGVPIAFNWERARYPFAHDRDLIRFSIKTAASGRQPGRPLNLVLLLDNSGSMERADRVRIRQECLRVLASQLQPQDRVSVVAFARTPRLWVDGMPGSQAAELPARVGELTPEGGTNLEEALRVGYQAAARHFIANGVNRVVLLTDGAANLGDVQPASLERQVLSNRSQGIALDGFGIGWEGFNDELLEQLTRHGDGRYGFVNTPEAAQKEFAGQLAGALQVAASDVKVQVEWNSQRVANFRQLGYAKHQLTKEQFRDNTVDAAEIGAAEAGNALYTVQVKPDGQGPLGVVRARYRVPGTNDYREQEWPLNYEGTPRPLEQAGPALRLAASASAFSEWLVTSPYAAEVTTDRLLGLLNGVADNYAADPRPKQFEQMLRQAKSVSGK